MQASKSCAVTELVCIDAKSNLVIQPSLLVRSEVAARTINPSRELAIGVDICIGFASKLTQYRVILDGFPKVFDRPGSNAIQHNILNDS